MTPAHQYLEEECISLDELYGEPWLSERHISFLFTAARLRVADLIDSRFRGAAIATGRRVAKSLRLLGVHPSAMPNYVVRFEFNTDAKNLDKSMT